jgi:pyruvate dehydrogenase E1 component alpha subunit/2-oxoisovalerate dehydrogenase E1 component alpha subunit
VQKLPLIVVAEYNHYAYSTPTSKQTLVKDLAEKAAGYGIPGYIVDGNDIIACYEITRKAADYARAGHGAVLIEAKTYRRKGHAEHDDQRYVPPAEIQYWTEKNDPVDRYERYLTERSIATPDEMNAITAAITRELDEDVEWAESSPMPEPEKAAFGVFDNSVVQPALRPKVFGGNY